MADSPAKFDPERSPRNAPARAPAPTPRHAAASSNRTAAEVAADASHAPSVLAGAAVPGSLGATQSGSASQAAAPRSVGIDGVETRLLHLLAEVKRLNPDTLSVRLQPDAHTALHLQLRLQQGQVNVEARLEQGDFDVWKARWPELQQRLESQGIRLGELQWAAVVAERPQPDWAPGPQTAGGVASTPVAPEAQGHAATAGQHGSADRHQPAPQPEPALRGLDSEPAAAPAHSRTASTRPKLQRVRGWEWWA